MKKFRFDKILFVFAIIIAAVTVAACSGSHTTTSTNTTTTISTATSSTTATSTQNQQYTINTMSKTGIGTYLVDSKGMTLYWTTRDSVGVSNITGTVLTNWPVFYGAGISVPSSLNASDFGSIVRNDGTMQTTFKGWPLYYYIGDKSAGDTLGQGLAGVWFAVVATASAPPSPATTTSTTTSTSSTTTTTTPSSSTSTTTTSTSTTSTTTTTTTPYSY